MDYQRHYDSLMAAAKARQKPEGYTERHHVVPRSMGGTDDEDNLVVLTAREHFIAHRLLWRIHRSPEMAHALNMMAIGRLNDFGFRTSKKYQVEREAFAQACSQPRPKTTGSRNPGAKLTEKDVIEIKHLLTANTKISEIMGKFKVSNTAIRKIRDNLKWTSVPWPTPINA